MSGCRSVAQYLSNLVPASFSLDDLHVSLCKFNLHALSDVTEPWKDQNLPEMRHFLFLCQLSGQDQNCSTSGEINLAVRHFFDKPIRAFSLLWSRRLFFPFSSQTTNWMSQNALCSLSRRGGQWSWERRMWWRRRQKKRFKRYVLCFPRGSRLFQLFIFVQTFRS